MSFLRSALTAGPPWPPRHHAASISAHLRTFQDHHRSPFLSSPYPPYDVAVGGLPALVQGGGLPLGFIWWTGLGRFPSRIAGRTRIYTGNLPKKGVYNKRWLVVQQTF